MSGTTDQASSQHGGGKTASASASGIAATPLYRLSGLTFRAGDRVIVHPVDLVVPPRQVLALVGPNGSGKSTLLKMMARQLRLPAARPNCWEPPSRE